MYKVRYLIFLKVGEKNIQIIVEYCGKLLYNKNSTILNILKVILKK